jgi:hypothetical protein
VLVLDRNIFKIPVTDITRPGLTAISNGEIVYQAREATRKVPAHAAVTAGITVATLLAAGCGGTAPESSAAGAAAAPATTLVLVNGEIHTPRGWAQAMAVKDGVIVAVGDAAAVEPWKSGAKVLDLAGATVLPGLHDMHFHPTMSGLQAEFSCSFPQGSNLERVLEAVKACVAKRGKGEWITGGQWDVASLGTAPQRTLLDAVSPENPWCWPTSAATAPGSTPPHLPPPASPGTPPIPMPASSSAMRRASRPASCGSSPPAWFASTSRPTPRNRT